MSNRYGGFSGITNHYGTPGLGVLGSAVLASTPLSWYGPVNSGRSPSKPAARTRAAHNAQFGGTDQWGEYSYIWNVSDWQSGVNFVQPEFYDAYNGTTGYWEIQDFTFEEVTDVLIAQAAADSALSGLSNKLNKAGDTITGRINLSVEDGIFAGTDLNNGVYLGVNGLVGKKLGTTNFAITTAGDVVVRGDIYANQFFGKVIDTANVVDNALSDSGVVERPTDAVSTSTAWVTVDTLNITIPAGSRVLVTISGEFSGGITQSSNEGGTFTTLHVGNARLLVNGTPTRYRSTWGESRASLQITDLLTGYSGAVTIQLQQSSGTSGVSCKVFAGTVMHALVMKK